VGWGVRRTLPRLALCNTPYTLPYTLHPPPPTLHYTLHTTPCTLHPTPYSSTNLNSTPYTLHSTPYTLHPSPYILHPTPYTLHPTPHTLHPTPYTLHPTPYILHPTPYILHPTPYSKTKPVPHPRRCRRGHWGWSRLTSPLPCRFEKGSYLRLIDFCINQL